MKKIRGFHLLEFIISLLISIAVIGMMVPIVQGQAQRMCVSTATYLLLGDNQSGFHSKYLNYSVKYDGKSAFTTDSETTMQLLKDALANQGIDPNKFTFTKC